MGNSGLAEMTFNQICLQPSWNMHDALPKQ